MGSRINAYLRFQESTLSNCILNWKNIQTTCNTVILQLYFLSRFVQISIRNSKVALICCSQCNRTFCQIMTTSFRCSVIFIYVLVYLLHEIDSLDSMFFSFTQTGIVEEHIFVIHREQAIDKPRSQIMVNHSTPGPIIYVKLGNRVRVKVINELNDDATSVHWHGMSLFEQPWMDGVIDISQCPITNVPGYNSFIYEFIPQSTGTFWYHGHYHSQYPDGK